jgi:hypothetical protein
VLRQVRELHWAEKRGHDLEALGETDQPRLVELVGQLPAGGREQHERQDEQRTDDQPGQAGRQPLHLQLVHDQHGEGELEDVVVGRAQKLHPEERGEAALAQQVELVR